MVLTLVHICLAWVTMVHAARRSRQQASLKHTYKPFNKGQLFDDLDKLDDPLSLLDVAMKSVKDGWAADDADSGSYTTVVNSVFEEAVPGMISLIGIQFPVLSVLGGMMHGVLSQSGKSDSESIWAGKVINQMHLLITATIWDLKRDDVRNNLWALAERTQLLEYSTNLLDSIESLLEDMVTDISEVFGSCNQQATSESCQGWRTEAGAATLLYELLFTESFVALAAYGEKEAEAQKEDRPIFKKLRTDKTNDMITWLTAHYDALHQYRGDSSNYQAASYTKTDTRNWYQWSCEEFEYKFTVGRDTYLGRPLTGVNPCSRVRNFTETCCEWGLVGQKCASVRVQVNQAMRQWDSCLSNYQSRVVDDLKQQFQQRIVNLKLG